MPKIAITEASGIGSPLTPAATKGRLKVTLITAGVGSSGYYSPKVLQNAAKDKVFPAGTHCFVDHPGNAETYDRPERSIRDLAAVLTEDATWDEDVQGLVAEAQAFGPYHSVLAEMADSIGVSIRAYADSTVGEYDGKKMPIITQLVEGISADFVTRAGRGGFFEVLESARPEQVIERAIRSGVAEATANDTRDALGTALKDAYGGEKTWTWVRDFDDTTVWYQFETPDGTGTYAEEYEIDDAGAVTLSGSPVEVRARTEYVPVRAAESAPTNVPAPAGQSNTTEESQEDTMPQIEESRLAQLEADAGRVQTLESERDQAARERDEAREALAVRDRRDAAGVIIDAQAREAGVTFTALERRGLLAALPVTESGGLDETAYTETVKEAAAEKATADGAGAVRGFGASTTPQDTNAIKAAESAAAAAFGRQVKEA